MTKRILNIFVILAVLDLLGAGAFWFGYSMMQKKKNQETELRAELADEAKKATQQASLRRALKQAEKERGALAKYFYAQSEEDQINFVAEIEALGFPTSGVLVETASFSLVAGETPSFRAEFGLKGVWEEVYHFLRLAETFPARLVIRRFTVQSQGGTSPQAAVWTGGASIELISLKSN